MYLNPLHQALSGLDERNYMSLASWAPALSAAGVACAAADIEMLTKLRVVKDSSSLPSSAHQVGPAWTSGQRL